jgi:predicted ATP-binding protein involved in virulence
MAFYLEKAIFINRAPFEHLELDFKEKGINVLSAVNGMGKTTILSYIVDALYEMAKPAFNQEFEGKEHKYYRISSSIYNIDMGKPSYVYLRFRNGEDNSYRDYLDIRNNCTEDEYNKAITINNKIDFSQIRETLKAGSNIKYWSSINNVNEKVEKVFKNNVLTYFPAYRYEKPSYLNNPYSVTFEYKKVSSYVGELPNPIEVVSDITDLSNWILDVLLDLRASEQHLIIQINNQFVNQTISGEESTLWNNLNTVLSNALFSKKYHGIVRFGIGSRNRGATRICIMNDIDGKSTCICPSVFNLSSGELSLISLFGEIIRQADNLKNNTKLEEIQGIVLIDEVDKHLHIRLQKEILPKLFKLFPNIQFLVSSHSPFLNMGLADEAMDRTQIIDLDNNGLVCEPTNNDLYKEVYEMMINENQRFADKYKDLENKTKTFDKPVIITEGKTDWKHIKAALSYFKENHEYEDIDIEILEYDFDFGDSKLHNLLNQYKTFPHRYKIVGLFDCDEDNGKAINSAGGIKKYGDNIWGMSIPVPDFRNYNTSGISIEFLYKDKDLKSQDENGRRIFTTSEFNEIGRLEADHRIGVKNNHDVKKYIQPEKEKIQADEVIDIDGNSLALSKEQFATNILNKKGCFANVSFDAFRPVFDRLKSILQQS